MGIVFRAYQNKINYKQPKGPNMTKQVNKPFTEAGTDKLKTHIAAAFGGICSIPLQIHYSALSRAAKNSRPT